MNVYVRELSRELGRMGLAVDVFTRSQDPTIRRVVPLGEGARVVHLPAGPETPMARERIHDHLDEFVDGVEAWGVASGVEYDLIHDIERQGKTMQHLRGLSWCRRRISISSSLPSRILLSAIR